MTRKSTQDDLLSDDLFYTVAGNSIQGSYIAASSGGSSSGSTTGSVISAASGGITINLILDAAAQAAPTSFKNWLQQAVSILAANITDKITVNINIDYSGTGGGAAAGPDSGYYESYAWTRSELINPCEHRRHHVQQPADRHLDPGTVERRCLERRAQALGCSWRQRHED